MMRKRDTLNDETIHLHLIKTYERRSLYNALLEVKLYTKL
jgi:hypothetical protein